MNSTIRFANPKIETVIKRLCSEEFDNKQLCDRIERALSDLENNAHCGIEVPRELVSTEFSKRHCVDNFWKYSLTGRWRLIYTINNGEVRICSLVLEFRIMEGEAIWFEYPPTDI